MGTWAARVRMPVQYAGFVLGIAGAVITVIDVLLLERGVGAPVGALLIGAGVVLWGVAFALVVAAPAVKAEVLEVAPPVEGTWLAVNSPTTKVPSHGTHGYGQSYAVDLVYAPEGVERPEFGKAGGAFLPPERFPAFGRPVLAPADAEVVRVTDRIRDHRSRSSWLGFAWFFLESVPRELRGLNGVLGNHVVLRLPDGSHFVLAHLRRGSARVSVGDRVRAGQAVAECGNTGNSTEPHLHCQRQDVANTFIAAGLPWTLPGGIPASNESREL